MTESPLQIARRAYQPKMPQALMGQVSLQEGRSLEFVMHDVTTVGLLLHGDDTEVIAVNASAGDEE